MKISFTLIDRAQAIVDGVVKSSHIFRRAVFNRDPRVFTKRHGEITVETPGWINIDRQGKNISPGLPAVAEEIAEGRFHAGRGLAIPIHAQDQIPVALGIHRDPDMLNNSRPGHIHQGGGGALGQLQRRTHLPFLPQIAGGQIRSRPMLAKPRDLLLRGGADLCHAALAPGAINILR